jgi:hypothetical protein
VHHYEASAQPVDAELPPDRWGGGSARPDRAQFRDGLKGGDIAASQQRTAHRRGRVDVWLGEALNLHDATVQLGDRLKGHDTAAGGPVELRITNVSPARW